MQKCVMDIYIEHGNKGIEEIEVVESKGGRPPLLPLSQQGACRGPGIRSVVICTFSFTGGTSTRLRLFNCLPTVLRRMVVHVCVRAHARAGLWGMLVLLTRGTCGEGGTVQRCMCWGCARGTIARGGAWGGTAGTAASSSAGRLSIPTPASASATRLPAASVPAIFPSG